MLIMPCPLDAYMYVIAFSRKRIFRHVSVHVNMSDILLSTCLSMTGSRNDFSRIKESFFMSRDSQEDHCLTMRADKPRNLDRGYSNTFIIIEIWSVCHCGR